MFGSSGKPEIIYVWECEVNGFEPFFIMAKSNNLEMARNVATRFLNDAYREYKKGYMPSMETADALKKIFMHFSCGDEEDMDLLKKIIGVIIEQIKGKNPEKVVSHDEKCSVLNFRGGY